jgi:hypothetical protein
MGGTGFSSPVSGNAAVERRKDRKRLMVLPIIVIAGTIIHGEHKSNSTALDYR